MNNERVLVTGSNGFIGKNLIFRLKELGMQVITFSRKNTIQDLEVLIESADFIVHLAGVNRPKHEEEFSLINAGLTKSICKIIRSLGKVVPVIFASSAQSELNNAYGASKLDAEVELKTLKVDMGCSIYIFRLPGVFGKWSKPDYNSVVATFCHNISHDLPIQINNPDLELTLVYIDDLVEEFVTVIRGVRTEKEVFLVKPEYKIKIGDLANQINMFKDSRESLVTEKVGGGLVRKMYSTYLSYVSPDKFSYSIPSYGDERGMFAEILKTKDSGQFSFFTAKPGVVRGGHYHHTKTEKFLVVQGKARFGFKNISTDKTFEIIITSEDLKVVETIPGWAHDITNIGNINMIVMLWANEIFDSDCPDTFSHKVLE